MLLQNSEENLKNAILVIFFLTNLDQNVKKIANQILILEIFISIRLKPQ